MDLELMRACLLETGQAVRTQTIKSLKEKERNRLVAIAKEAKEDAIFGIDKDVEEPIIETLAKYADSLGGILLIAEGISENGEPLAIPAGIDPETAFWQVIIDPIDGTRGLMYDKRSGFFLAGAAPNNGIETRLSDILVSVMVELPTTRQYLTDSFSAIRSEGFQCFRENLITKEKLTCPALVSQEQTLIRGFAQIARYAPPGREILAAIDDELLYRLYPELADKKVLIFEDQYISTGGQMYEMLMGHDRFTADLRGRLGVYFKKKGLRPTFSSHPYDAAAFLIAEEAGCILTNSYGEKHDTPLDLETPADYILYANQTLYEHIWPVLKAIMEEKGL